jgi:hypothetical protein
MIAAGYMAKHVMPRPEWLNAPAVVDVCSVSGCISNPFCDYIRHWRHNGYWLFNSPAVIRELAAAEAIDLSMYECFYYEVCEQQFDERRMAWEAFEPEKSFATDVVVPENRELIGYDVTSFSAGTSPECSPLSCNNLAGTKVVNRHCLLSSLAEAKDLLESAAFNDTEPGPFRIFAVYRHRPA